MAVIEYQKKITPLICSTGVHKIISNKPATIPKLSMTRRCRKNGSIGTKSGWNINLVQISNVLSLDILHSIVSSRTASANNRTPQGITVPNESAKDEESMNGPSRRLEHIVGCVISLSVYLAVVADTDRDRYVRFSLSLPLIHSLSAKPDLLQERSDNSKLVNRPTIIVISL